MTIKLDYEKKNRKIWFKRFIITLILATIGIVFQIIAAYISPWLYPSTGYYRTVVLCGMLLFWGVNVFKEKRGGWKLFVLLYSLI